MSTTLKIVNYYKNCLNLQKKILEYNKKITQQRFVTSKISCYVEHQSLGIITQVMQYKTSPADSSTAVMHTGQQTITYTTLICKGVPRRQPHYCSGLATLPSVGAVP